MESLAANLLHFMTAEDSGNPHSDLLSKKEQKPTRFIARFIPRAYDVLCICVWTASEARLRKGRRMRRRDGEITAFITFYYPNLSVRLKKSTSYQVSWAGPINFELEEVRTTWFLCGFPTFSPFFDFKIAVYLFPLLVPAPLSTPLTTIQTEMHLRSQTRTGFRDIHFEVRCSVAIVVKCGDKARNWVNFNEKLSDLSKNLSEIHFWVMCNLLRNLFEWNTQ